MASVTLNAIRKTYDNGVEVIRGVDLQVCDGEFMVFVGPSGCGKSTMMRMIAGLEDISAGELRIGERLANDVPPADRGVAMVFQSYALYPHMTVAQNMGFSLDLAGLSKAEIAAQVGRVAEILQITHLLDRKPKALSGGQRQRVAIGRAIVRNPEVFLFDEPLSNLDASLRVQMRVELTKLHRQLGATMIYVTHDQVEAMTMGDRIAVFNAGVIEQVGTPLELYREPANVFVAQFMGSPRMNLMGAAASVGDTEVALRLTAQPQAAPTLRPLAGCALDAAALARVAQVGVRPESLRVVADSDAEAVNGGWPVRIDVTEHLGDSVLLHARFAGTAVAAEPLCLKLPAAQAEHWRPDDAVRVLAEPGALHLFDGQGRRLGAL
ncbi:MAG: sn-glycerol-3-phosphate ABC transporter ATP-binding protein UgpC [Burkholderiales bacterium]|nr:sn-glycerol-3-phosphate ABC transporter ATP-binding protein UgpC [Burkholderiales bacterium]